MMAFVAWACAPPPAPTTLDVWTVQDAVRASLAVRGLRPTPEEVDRIEADPGALPDLVDGWLYDPAFLAMVRDMAADWLETRSDTIQVWPSTGPLEGQPQGAVSASLAEAPLVRIEQIVAAGRPFTDVVTGGDPWVDAIGAAAEGLSFDADGPAWQESRWADGRPPDGVLADTRLWTRHNTNQSGKHRVRANLLSRVFLCDDIGARPIEAFDSAVLAPEAESDALVSDPGCLACHAALEPLASAFWGYRFGLTASNIADATERGCLGVDAPVCYPVRLYDPGAEDRWADFGLPPPAYAGAPLAVPGALGAAVAADARLPLCIARRVSAWMHRTPLDAVDDDVVAARAAAFVASGFDVRALVRDVVLADDFVGAGRAPRIAARPDAVARQLEDATGVILQADVDGDCPPGAVCWGVPVDLLRSDRFGWHTLAGGADGVVLRRADPGPSVPTAWVADEVAIALADRVVSAEFALPAASRRLLGGVEAETVGEDAVRAQVSALAVRLLSEGADASVDGWVELFEVGSSGSVPPDGWRLVLSTMLADPAVWTL